MYGDPEGRKVFPKDYASERREVAGLFRAFPEHPGVLDACKWLRGWLDASIAGDKSQPGYLHIARLDRWNITPLAILSEVCAVWLYAMRHPHTLPDDQRLTFALAGQALLLAPRDYVKSYHYKSGESRQYREARYEARKAIGDHLRLTLARLLVNVAHTCEERLQQKQNRAASFGLPFKPQEHQQ
ncbi:MAG: hypothetical protein ACYC9Z_04250 [Casimicrobiaceae bacterium]